MEEDCLLIYEYNDWSFCCSSLDGDAGVHFCDWRCPFGHLMIQTDNRSMSSKLLATWYYMASSFKIQKRTNPEMAPSKAKCWLILQSHFEALSNGEPRPSPRRYNAYRRTSVLDRPDRFHDDRVAAPGDRPWPSLCAVLLPRAVFHRNIGNCENDENILVGGLPSDTLF